MTRTTTRPKACVSVSNCLLNQAKGPRLGGRRVPQQQAAQRRRQRQRHEPGDRDRDRDGDRELFVELPGGPRQKRRRHEDRRHDEHGRDDGAPDLVHRADRGLPRRQVPLGHVPLDVLHHDDRIVHDDADREDEAEEREQVDGEPEREHERERAQQGHHHCRGADERGAEVLEEQVDDEDDEDDRLEQRVLDLGDGLAHELGGVERHEVVEAVREPRPHAPERGVHRRGDLQGVRARLLIDGDEGGGKAVQPAVDDVLAQADFDPRDVLEADDRAFALARPQDDVLVARRLGGRLLGDHRERQLDAPGRRLLPDLPGPVQRVLAETARWMSLVVIPSDAIRSGFIQIRIAWSGMPMIEAWPAPGTRFRRVEHVDVRVVCDVLAAVPLLLRVDADEHHDRGRLLLDRHALLHDGRRQLRHGQVHAVLDLHLGDVGVGVEGEVDGERQHARRRTRRRHVEHVVDAVDLRFDRRGHRVGERLRVGTGIDRADGDLDGRDRRVLLDGQHAHRHRSSQAQDDRHDRREDRPLDEEPREHGAAPSAGSTPAPPGSACGEAAW